MPDKNDAVIYLYQQEPKSHVATIRYMRADKNAAEATAGGTAKGISKGICYIYVYAHNGAAKRIKVTVKRSPAVPAAAEKPPYS